MYENIRIQDTFIREYLIYYDMLNIIAKEMNKTLLKSK